MTSQLLSSLIGEGPNSYWLTRALFQRALAVIYLVGFLVALNQFRPLLGATGCCPSGSSCRK